jgi:hypothetical protein
MVCGRNVLWRTGVWTKHLESLPIKVALGVNNRKILKSEVGLCNFPPKLFPFDFYTPLYL